MQGYLVQTVRYALEHIHSVAYSHLYWCIDIHETDNKIYSANILADLLFDRHRSFLINMALSYLKFHLVIYTPNIPLRSSNKPVFVVPRVILQMP